MLFRVVQVKGEEYVDRAEFTSQVLACERKMYKTAYCMLRNPADCQDAVQEAIFSAWRNLDRLRDAAAFDPWLMQILVNSCRTILRKRKRRGEVELDEAYMLPESPDPKLFQAIRDLDEVLRVPVILKYVNGYSSQETAQILRLPYRTVLTRLKKAREILQRELGEVKA